MPGIDLGHCPMGMAADDPMHYQTRPEVTARARRLGKLWTTCSGGLVGAPRDSFPAPCERSEVCKTRSLPFPSGCELGDES
ncbi:hypothetical protein EFW17_22545 [Halostreptopolyspora alba]|uniref:Uncharacterized protein n=1 Tax=Halostreptopolyspora alba TaxID=2487137 RepID=A0A3N0DYY5_9ACTN|nr:hypothetical protein EFW17_22545 [Nocardiopsaceae bacterium YIM 96095]